MHVCKTCGETDLSKFGIHSTSKRPHGYCKKCRYERHKEKAIEYYKSDKGKEVKRNSDRKYYESNKEDILSYLKVYRKKNRDILINKKKEYYTFNKDKILDKLAEYKKNNKDKVNNICAKRRANKLNASPNWGELNSFLIEEAYSLATLRSELTGIEHHVDHVIPLNNSLVCGLHVGINLQVITKYENLKKSNTVYL